MAYNETPSPTTHWYTSSEQTIRFARILAATGVLLSADDVINPLAGIRCRRAPLWFVLSPSAWRPQLPRMLSGALLVALMMRCYGVDD
jgi:hypothetical protein